MSYVCKLHSSELSIIFTALFVGFSGYFYYDITDDKLVLNHMFRAATLIVLLTAVVYAWVIQKRPKIPNSLLPLILFVGYLVAVSVARGSPPANWASEAVRWTTYLSGALLFSNIRKPRRSLKHFVYITSAIYIASYGLDLLTQVALHMNRAARVPGSVGSPIGFASAMYINAIICFYFFLSEKRYINLILVALLIIGTFLTATRSISFALVGTFTLWLIIQKTQSPKQILIQLLILILLSCAIIYGILYTSAGHRLTTLFTAPLDHDSSLGFRFFIANTVIKNIGDLNLLFGLGSGGFAPWFHHITGAAEIAPHFSALWLIAEGGIVGGGLYILSISTIFLKLLSLRRANKISQAAMLLSSICLLAQQGPFQFSNPLYFYQAMLPAFFVIGAVLNRQNPT